MNCGTRLVRSSRVLQRCFCAYQERLAVCSSRKRFCDRGVMAHSRLQLGILVPVNDVGAESDPSQPINLFEGFNTVGRSDLAAASKQVSRKHISIHASNGMFQVTVEGQNPVVLKKGTERQELKHQEKASICAGDVLELLPGKHAFQLTMPSSKNAEAMVNVEQPKVLTKRKRQELKDESLARALQAIENEDAQVSCAGQASTKSKADIPSNPVLSSESSYKLHDLTHGQCPRTFQLLKVKGLPSGANSTCLSIQDVIEFFFLRGRSLQMIINAEDRMLERL
ncbi:hypothetical protein L7F22_023025 [Adiantum nelumboides]|nr:hypothetical protein [Adiantum nelumboides]